MFFFHVHLHPMSHRVRAVTIKYFLRAAPLCKNAEYHSRMLVHLDFNVQVLL